MKEGQINKDAYWIPKKCPECGSQLLKSDTLDGGCVFCSSIMCHYGLYETILDLDEEVKNSADEHIHDV